MRPPNADLEQDKTKLNENSSLLAEHNEADLYRNITKKFSTQNASSLSNTVHMAYIN